MARVSRKNIAVTTVSADEELKPYKACLYLRLSDEDERSIEDNSIGNQKKICLEHLKKLPEIKVTASYIDNGASGTNFSRPGFKRMLQDLTNGRINCVVVKDLSRLGRNYLETSEYLEKFFPEAGIRFIAVNNGYDSIRKLDGKQEIVIPFSNIVNDMYAKDVSRKIRSSIKTLMKCGEFLPPSGSIPYGYLRDEKKLDIKVCQQYALPQFAQNVILIDTGHAKLMTPFFNLEKLRKVPGCENAMIVDPYAGGKGNSIRYMAVSPRDNYMRAQGMSNLFVGGEKSGFYVGHTEAICTGSLAGHNAARFCAGVDFLQLPESIAIGDMLKYSNIEMHKQDGDKLRFTFAGGLYFNRMKELGLYTTDKEIIEDRIKKTGLFKVYDKKIIGSMVV